MRDRVQNKGVRGHLLTPAFLLLATLALAIPGSVGHLPAPPADLVVSASVQRDVAELRELVDGGACRLLSAAAESDRISSGFVGIMLRFTEALDRVSRDATAFMAWVENVMTHDTLDALDVVVEGVAGWFAGSFDPPRCADTALQSPEIPEPSCQV